MLATSLNYEGAFELAAKFFLLSHVGEGGQACPIVCTVDCDGLSNTKALKVCSCSTSRTDGDGLVGRATRFSVSHEVQGGSDVGANITCAIPDPEIEVRGELRRKVVLLSR